MTNRQLELVKLLENNGSLTIRELSQNLYISEQPCAAIWPRWKRPI